MKYIYLPLLHAMHGTIVKNSTYFYIVYNVFIIQKGYSFHFRIFYILRF